MVEFELPAPDMAAIKGHFGCLQKRSRLRFQLLQHSNAPLLLLIHVCVSQSDLSPKNSHPTVLQSQLKVAHPTQKVENEGTGVEVHNPPVGVEILKKRHFCLTFKCLQK